MHNKTQKRSTSRIFFAAALILFGFSGFPGIGDAAPAAAKDTTPWPIILRNHTTRLADVTYRVQRTAAPICPSSSSVSGIVFDFIEAYNEGDREGVASLLKMTRAPQIAAVAAGSPAERAGVKPGADLVAINGQTTEALLAASANRTLFADELDNLLAAQPASTPVELRLREDGVERTVSIQTEQGCAGRVVLKTGEGIDAYTDGEAIGVSSKLLDYTRNDDELAFIISHEFGHIISQDGKAKSLGQRRSMEDRADVLGTRLTICAGYRMELATQYWLRRDAGDALRWFRDPTHRSRKARVLRMETEAKTVTCPPSAEALPLG